MIGITTDLNVINTFKPNGISHFFQMDQSITILKVTWWPFSYYSNLIHSVSNSGDPDQTLSCPASGLGLHCLHMSHKKGARLTWVNG